MYIIMSETFVKFDVLQQLKFQDKPILRTYPILRGCYPPQPPAYVDNTFLDLLNSPYPTQPHSLIAKYFSL